MNGGLKVQLANMLKAAMAASLGFEEDPAIMEASDVRFGDYQSNVAIRLARKLNQNPRDVACQVVKRLELNGIGLPEIAGPGFINLRLNPGWLGGLIGSRINHPRLGIEPTPNPQKIIVDFSSPNVAKRMHAGHLRSTIIGDALVRILRFAGHEVLGDNHVGDYGTQFGLLIYGFKCFLDTEGFTRDAVAELERLYQVMTELCKGDSNVEAACKAELVKLQSGDPDNASLWENIVLISRAEAAKIYRRLGVEFELWRGESYYAQSLAPLVGELASRGLAKNSEGALAVFFPKSEDLSGQPFLIQKSDGGYLYSTTDIATLKSRVEELKADRIIYVVDSRQALHFKQLFATARLMGYQTELEHVGFGMMLGSDGRPFRTRDGGTIRLEALIDEGEARIKPLVQRKWPDMPAEEMHETCARIAVGAIKYADLSHNLETDYKFDWDKFLNPDGNTGPYLQYTLVRAGSVLRTSAEKTGTHVTSEEGAICLETAEDVQLGKALLGFPDVIEEVAAALRPHLLCEHLYRIARAYNLLYSKRPIIWAENEEVCRSRLTLSLFVRRTLRTGLDILNIPQTERM
ncbi:MAG: arginine--tRNA ligase [Acidobacteriota bacterium]|jgi:arginyl-tRNA synthetase